MTEPTRDALHAETLDLLARSEKSWRDSGIQWEEPHAISVADRFAHAAACVRRVPELEAEVERLREELAVTAKILAERERECIALRPAYKATSYGPGLTRPTPRTDG